MSAFIRKFGIFRRRGLICGDHQTRRNRAEVGGGVCTKSWSLVYVATVSNAVPQIQRSLIAQIPKIDPLTDLPPSTLSGTVHRVKVTHG